MEICKSHIVISLAGRDKDKLFFVVDLKDEFLLLADGKNRRIEAPKLKKRRHAAFAADFDCRVSEKLRSGDRVTNAELRRALAEYSDTRTEAESLESHAGQQRGGK